jgi:hypothetical protein
MIAIRLRSRRGKHDKTADGRSSGIFPHRNGRQDNSLPCSIDLLKNLYYTYEL